MWHRPLPADLDLPERRWHRENQRHAYGCSGPAWLRPTHIPRAANYRIPVVMAICRRSLVPEPPRARMADRDARGLRDRARADVQELGLDLVKEQIDHVGRAGRPERAQPIGEAAAGEAEPGAERERTHHIEPAADAGIDHHSRARADRRDD